MLNGPLLFELSCLFSARSGGTENGAIELRLAAFCCRDAIMQQNPISPISATYDENYGWTDLTLGKTENTRANTYVRSGPIG